MKTQIAEDARDEILKQNLEGKSANEIATWLTLYQGETITAAQVRNHFKQLKRDRHADIRDVYRQALAPTVFSDIEVLNYVMSLQTQTCEDSKATVKEKQNACKLMIQVVKLRGSLSGMVRDDGTQDVRQELLKMAERIRALPLPKEDELNSDESSEELASED